MRKELGISWKEWLITGLCATAALICGVAILILIITIATV